jgi:Uncharacterized conserved protein
MKIFTIGFTQKSAADFFQSIQNSGAKRVIDVRLNNVSQLAGFAKRDDLAFFLKELCGIDYVHRLDLAPTPTVLDKYRKDKKEWRRFEREFLQLLRERKIERKIPKELMSGACLLCSEDKPHHCHRRMIAEYLQQHWHDVEIVHLG